MAIDDVYSPQKFGGFEIDEIKGGDTGPIPSGPITFEYDNPGIGINTGSEFVKHEIIGGSIVRQRIGDNPLEIDINGVCREPTAKELELLRNSDWCTLFSTRFADNAVQVHVVSIDTTPFEEGGSVKLGDDEFLYSYTLNCVEIRDSGDS